MSNVSQPKFRSSEAGLLDHVRHLHPRQLLPLKFGCICHHPSARRDASRDPCDSSAFAKIFLNNQASAISNAIYRIPTFDHLISAVLKLLA